MKQKSREKKHLAKSLRALLHFFPVSSFSSTKTLQIQYFTWWFLLLVVDFALFSVWFVYGLLSCELLSLFVCLWNQCSPYIYTLILLFFFFLLSDFLALIHTFNNVHSVKFACIELKNSNEKKIKKKNK